MIHSETRAQKKTAWRFEKKQPYPREIPLRDAQNRALWGPEAILLVPDFGGHGDYTLIVKPVVALAGRSVLQDVPSRAEFRVLEHGVDLAINQQVILWRWVDGSGSGCKLRKKLLERCC